MTFIDYDGTELVLESRQVVLAAQALKQTDGNLFANFLFYPGIPTDVRFRYTKKRLNSLNPLIQNLFAMN